MKKVRAGMRVGAVKKASRFGDMAYVVCIHEGI